MSIFLKQSTSIDVRIGPFVDVGDGFTPETAVALTTADEAEALKANGAATSDISGRTWAAVTGCDGWYDLTLSTADTDTVGELLIVVQDDSVCLPVFQRFQVVEEAVYDDLFGASADPFTVMQSDVVAIESALTIVASDVAAIHSQTTVIESDTVVISSDTAAIHSDTTIIASDVVILVSDTTAIHSQTTVIESDTVVISSDTAAIHSDTTIIASDVVQVYSDTTVIASDVVILVSDTTAIHSQTTVIESDVALFEAAHSEPAGVPAANESPLDKLGYLYMALRNQVTVTATKKTFFDDAGTAEWEKDLSDDGTTYTETEGNAI